MVDVDIDYSILDPGIRVVVATLRAMGLETSDSGDGETKPHDCRTVEGPHVYMGCKHDDLILTCEFVLEGLRAFTKTKLKHVAIQGMYDPAVKSAGVLVVGLHDRLLAPKLLKYKFESEQRRARYANALHLASDWEFSEK
jgi:hypothetical protein